MLKPLKYSLNKFDNVVKIIYYNYHNITLYYRDSIPSIESLIRYLNKRNVSISNKFTKKVIIKKTIGIYFNGLFI